MEYLDSDSVRLSEDDSAVIIIDQTLLPLRTEYKYLRTAEEIFEAIKNLRVRGAPAIGICAGYGMFILSRRIISENADVFTEELKNIGKYLCSARPTAVNLSAAVKRMISEAERNKDLSVNELREVLKITAENIHKEDIEMCRKISEYGLSLVKNGDGILTHCNAGPLATSRYGTGLGTLFLGKERGYEFHVYADETRPLLQGARLTAYELDKAGIDVTLVCDNMAASLMKAGKIQAVFAGCDRVAANGDTANKIGTSGAAIIAKYYGVPFYVFCPSTTIDLSCENGGEIPIEFRDGGEIRTMFFKEPIAPDVKCYNPSFDVTDNELITAIITENGICRPPYGENLKKLSAI